MANEEVAQRNQKNGLCVRHRISVSESLRTECNQQPENHHAASQDSACVAKASVKTRPIRSDEGCLKDKKNHPRGEDKSVQMQEWSELRRSEIGLQVVRSRKSEENEAGRRNRHYEIKAGIFALARACLCKCCRRQGERRRKRSV